MPEPAAWWRLPVPGGVVGGPIPAPASPVWPVSLPARPWCRPAGSGRAGPSWVVRCSQPARARRAEPVRAPWRADGESAHRARPGAAVVWPPGPPARGRSAARGEDPSRSAMRLEPRTIPRTGPGVWTGADPGRRGPGDGSVRGWRAEAVRTTRPTVARSTVARQVPLARLPSVCAAVPPSGPDAAAGPNAMAQPVARAHRAGAVQPVPGVSRPGSSQPPRRR